MNLTAKHVAAPEQFVFNRRIGSTLYKVNVYSCDAGLEANSNELKRETLEQKVLRLMKNDLHYTLRNATIEPLQAGWLSERGSA